MTPSLGVELEVARTRSQAVTINGRQTLTIVTKNLNYGKTTARQGPLTGQLGFRLTF